MIDAGNSLSGREPNCAFLNMGDGSFATVSALSGFDHADDARSIALTDWDGDGDLDAWVTNRTAPGVRFLRNNTPGGNSVIVRLEGLEANRDAAGARVEITLASSPDRPLVRTVKLGEGFLGQSSRALHFGVGRDETIASVQVVWPGGRRERIHGASPGTTVAFTQGDPAPMVRPHAPRTQPSPPAPLAAESPSLSGPGTLFHPSPFPALPSIKPGGDPWLVDDSDGPVLVNLFASWCPDCATELKEWAAAASDFKAAGLTPVLLCADGRDERHNTKPSDAWPWLAANGIPFEAGVLTDEAFRRLAKTHQLAFGALINLPIPTSFLLDGHGRLAAVYRGIVPASRVLADAAAATQAAAQPRRPDALPFTGDWVSPPDGPDPSIWLSDLVAASAWEEAVRYFKRHGQTLRRHRQFDSLAGAFADKLAAAGHPGPAIAAYRDGLAKSPENVSLLNNLATLLVTAPETSLRNPADAVALAESAVRLTQATSAPVLDTLATAQAASGQFAAAVATAERALAIAESRPDQASLVDPLKKAIAAYREGRFP